MLLAQRNHGAAPGWTAEGGCPHTRSIPANWREGEPDSNPLEQWPGENPIVFSLYAVSSLSLIFACSSALLNSMVVITTNNGRQVLGYPG
jgi:hypothetical protein